jgi:hypothetical protein
MKREMWIWLLAFAVCSTVPGLVHGQGAPITGWDRVRFGMTPRQIIALYPGAQFNERRQTVTIRNPAEATVLAICHFETSRCSGVSVILGATDQLAILRGLERRYGPSTRHDQRFGSERYFWGNPREAVISMFLVTDEWLDESRLRDARLDEFEGHVTVFYLDRPGSTPTPAWQPRPPL